MEVRSETFTVTTTGGAGIATGSAFSPAMNGFLLDIFIDFDATAPATTVTTISFEGAGGNILVVSASATDALFTPRAKAVDNANAAIAGSAAHFPLNGRIRVALSASNALSPAATITVRYLAV